MNSFKKVFSFLFISLFFILVVSFLVVNYANALVTSSSSLSFSRDLSFGDYGEDVLALQKILNSDPDTIIALSGPGSPGQETYYFGSLTQGAVIKYQNKYSAEVLAPVGLSYGTGYFGQSTISHIQKRNMAQDLDDESELITSEDLQQRMQEILNQNNSETGEESEADSDSDVVSSENSDENFAIDYISQSVAERGDEVAVVSHGIDSTSRIILRKSGIDKVVYGKITTSAIYFTIPSIGYGTYEVYIKNGTQLSDPATIRIVDDIDPPKISSISFSGEAIGHGDTVVIKGERLSGKNTVMTPLGTYTVNSSNSTEFRFTVGRQLDEQTFSVFSGQTFRGYIRVKNDNGESNVKSVRFIYD